MTTMMAQKVSVNILTMTATMVTNTVFRMLFRIASERGLPPNYINENRKIIEDGLSTWVYEQTLTSLTMEVYQEGQTNSMERFRFDFVYLVDPNMQATEPPVKTLQELTQTLKNLPQGSKYRVVVNLKEGASTVPGWVTAESMPLNKTKESKVGDWGFGHASVTLTYEGSDW